MPYPLAFPMASIETLIAYFTPGDPTPKICEVAEAGYDLLGYAMSKLLPHDHEDKPGPVFFSGPLETDADKAAFLCKVRDAAHADPAGAQGAGEAAAVDFAIPWLAVWALIKQLVDEFLAS